jgi:hypothetical protein
MSKEKLAQQSQQEGREEKKFFYSTPTLIRHVRKTYVRRENRIVRFFQH